MTTIRTHARIGPDKKLHLDLTPDLPEGEVDVVVVLQPVKAPVPTGSRDPEIEAARRFVEETAGRWVGEPLVRPPQPELEKREEWG